MVSSSVHEGFSQTRRSNKTQKKSDHSASTSKERKETTPGTTVGVVTSLELVNEVQQTEEGERGRSWSCWSSTTWGGVALLAAVISGLAEAGLAVLLPPVLEELFKLSTLV